jgi:hypothetical protein
MAGANEDEPQAIVKRQDFAITHVGRAAVGGAEARVSFLSTHAESFQPLSGQLVIRSIHTALSTNRPLSGEVKRNRLATPSSGGGRPAGPGAESTPPPSIGVCRDRDR